MTRRFDADTKTDIPAQLYCEKAGFITKASPEAAMQNKEKRLIIQPFFSL